MSKINSLEQFHSGVAKICESFTQKAMRHDFNHINLQLLQLIKMDYFGQMSAVAYAVKAQSHSDGSVTLTPFTPDSLKAIYQAIVNFQTNWNVTLQKEHIRIAPRLITTDAKMQLQRKVQGYAEEAKVSFRQLRHDLLKFWKQSELSETIQKQNERMLQTALQTATQRLETALTKQLKRIQNF